MKVCHDVAKNLAQESNEKAVDHYTKEHDKKIVPRKYKEGEKVLAPASKASREVENFDWRKNSHPSVYGVKKFVTLTVCY
jgi:hypothetical protein